MSQAIKIKGKELLEGDGQDISQEVFKHYIFPIFQEIYKADREEADKFMYLIATLAMSTQADLLKTSVFKERYENALKRLTHLHESMRGEVRS